MTKEIEELKEEFVFFDDWEDRYTYLIELGKRLPDLDEKYKVNSNIVSGCSSKVWIQFTNTDKSSEIISFLGDSDSYIVKGLIAILVRIYSGKTRNEILAINLENLFKEIGFAKHLSPNRVNGFYSMIQKIHTETKCKN